MEEDDKEYPIPKDYLEHPNYHENHIIQDEYIMHTQKTLPTSYLYYERIDNQCKNCKYSHYNKPSTYKGTGWYDCKKGLNTRIKRYCFNFVEKTRINNNMINKLD